MKKLTALLLTGALSLSLFGCKDKTGTQQTSEDVGQSGVWLLTSETSYNADGSKGYAHVTYTYTDKGMPLTETYDYGLTKQVYDDDLGIYVNTHLPYDGQVDQKVEYTYNDQGNLLYYVLERTAYNEDGSINQEQCHREDDTKDRYDIYYDDQGRVEKVNLHSAMIGGGASKEIYLTYYFCYDDNGQLFEIYGKIHNKNAPVKTQWVYEYRYDDNGRLVTSASYQRDGLFSHEYTYNANGQLTGITEYRRTLTSPLDDQQTVTQDYALEEPAEPTQRASATFTYDSDGRLTGRTGTVPAKCTYGSNGKLKTVTYSDGNKFVYVDSEDDVDTDATYLVRDKNGNVVKMVRPDGTYMVFTYEKFDLSAEDAARCNAVRLTNDSATVYGQPQKERWSWVRYKGSFGYVPNLPIPETALHFTDELLARVYRNR